MFQPKVKKQLHEYTKVYKPYFPYYWIVITLQIIFMYE